MQAVADLGLHLQRGPRARAPGGQLQNTLKHHHPQKGHTQGEDSAGTRAPTEVSPFPWGESLQSLYSMAVIVSPSNTFICGWNTPGDVSTAMKAQLQQEGVHGLHKVSAKKRHTWSAQLRWRSSCATRPYKTPITTPWCSSSTQYIETNTGRVPNEITKKHVPNERREQHCSIRAKPWRQATYYMQNSKRCLWVCSVNLGEE